MEKYIFKAREYGSSQVSETNRIWKNILRRSNMVLLRYLRQMKKAKKYGSSQVSETNAVSKHYQSDVIWPSSMEMEYNEDVTPQICNYNGHCQIANV